jgi:hypothetical protein
MSTASPPAFVAVETATFRGPGGPAFQGCTLRDPEELEESSHVLGLQSEQKADYGSEKPCPFLPMRSGIERLLQTVTDRLCGDDLAEPALPPGRHSGTRDLEVPGNGLGAKANEVLTQAMVVGAPYVASFGGSRCHLRKTPCISQCLDDIKGAQRGGDHDSARTR